MIDVAEELGFPQQRLPSTGQGSHKPNLGRGGIALPDNYYFPDNDLNVKMKKGEGIAAPVKSNQLKDNSKPKWSDII